MRKLALLPIAAAVCAPLAWSQSIVYDNTSSSLENNFPLLPEWLDESVEAGDEIWLQGSDRVAVELKLIFTYRGTIPGTLDARIRFREILQDTESPGAAFYDSGLVSGLSTLGGLNEFTFDIPHVTVPDRFVWTVQVFNRQGSVGEIGPSYFHPPTVGSSEDFFWLSNGIDWTPYSWGGDPFANFGARLTAVPEPATLYVLGGLVALFWRSRRA